jgi:hypothetical protein
MSVTLSTQLYQKLPKNSDGSFRIKKAQVIGMSGGLIAKSNPIPFIA